MKRNKKPLDREQLLEQMRALACAKVNDAVKLAYLPEEERDAIAWVREHGGIEALRRMFQDADNRRVELCAALGIDLDKGWSEAMAAMHLRLMPEGMEWPRFEDGEPLRVGDEVCGGGRAFIVDHVVLFSNGESTVCAEADMDSGKVRDYARVRPSYRLKRPAPKVLDADGAEIREKCDVWWICEGDERGVHAERLRVETIGPNGLIECSPYNGGTWVHLEPSELYVNKPVLSADGRPLREGEKVSNDRGDRFTVVKVDHERGIFSARNERTGTVAIGLSSARFTHERPDSYQRLYMDMAGQGQGNSIGFGEFVRRAQELAEHPPMREERRDGR